MLDERIIRALPNFLTLLRVLCAPSIFVLSLWGRQDGLCFVLYALACVSDFLDGYLARKWRYQSRFGRMLDPIADKLLVLCVMVVVMTRGVLGGLSLGVALVILAREVMVSGLREFLAEVNQKLPVTSLAKWKTGSQMVALGLLLLGMVAACPVLLRFYIVSLGVAFLWLSCALSVLTGFLYVRRSYRFYRL